MHWGMWVFWRSSSLFLRMANFWPMSLHPAFIIPGTGRLKPASQGSSNSIFWRCLAGPLGLSQDCSTRKWGICSVQMRSPHSRRHRGALLSRFMASKRRRPDEKWGIGYEQGFERSGELRRSILSSGVMIYFNLKSLYHRRTKNKIRSRFVLRSGSLSD